MPNTNRTWIPGAIRCPTHPSRVGAIRDAKRIKRVLIHITDGHGSVDGPGEMWTKPGKTCAQVCIGQDARVLQTMPLEALCWHAHSASYNSIAIEHCARSPGEFTRFTKKPDPGLPLSRDQLDKSVLVAAFIARTFGFEPSEITILGHKAADDATDHDDCPDGVLQPDGVTVGWPWKWYRDAVAAALRTAA